MKSSAAFLSLALFVVSAAAADTQAPGAQTPNTQTPGVTPGVTPAVPGTTPNPNLQPSPGGQTPSMTNPGSTQSPSQTPGTEFPSQNPTAPNQTGTLPRNAAARTRAQILTDVRGAVMQLPGSNLQGTLPGTEVEEARVQDLRVFRRQGKIVLTGRVATQAEKDAAGNRARSAAGGQEIVNQLEVK